MFGISYARHTIKRSLRDRFGSNASPLYPQAVVMLGTILVVVLLLMLLGSLPTWPHSRQWGYYPSGALGMVFVIVLILLLLGRI